MRGYVQRLLKERFRVVSAENGKAAFEKALRKRPDLVLTDVMMPEMDGFQLLAALRSHPSTKTVPVIMLSARAGEEARIEGLEATADDYLTKAVYFSRVDCASGCAFEDGETSSAGGGTRSGAHE